MAVNTDLMLQCRPRIEGVEDKLALQDLKGKFVHSLISELQEVRWAVDEIEECDASVNVSYDNVNFQPACIYGTHGFGAYSDQLTKLKRPPHKYHYRLFQD